MCPYREWCCGSFPFIRVSGSRTMFARRECCPPHKPDPPVPSPSPPTALLTYLHSDWSILEVGFVGEGWSPSHARLPLPRL